MLLNKKYLFFLLFIFFVAEHSFAQRSINPVVQKVENAIFTVSSVNSDGMIFAKGSGFFISNSGIGITNYHVLDGAHDAFITTRGGDKIQIEIVYDYSATLDLVKFKVSNKSLIKFPWLRISKTTPLSGDEIFNISTPLGIYEHTVAKGTVAAVRKSEQYGEVIQMTTPISHGSSGSPVMNMKGEVIGIATYGNEAGQQLNFAVSSKNIKRLNLQRNIQVKYLSVDPLMTPRIKDALKEANEGNVVSALNILQTEINRNSSNHRARYYKALILMRAESYDDAYQLACDACNADPSSSEYFVLLGKILSDICISYKWSKKAFSLAIQALQNAYNLNSDPEILYRVGHLCSQVAMYSDNKEYYAKMGIDFLNKAIMGDPEQAACFIDRAHLFQILRDHGNASVDCNQAIRIDPYHYRPYLMRGDMKIYDYNNFKDGIIDLDQAVALSERSYYVSNAEKADIYGLRGMSYGDEAFRTLNRESAIYIANAVKDLEKANSLYPQGSYSKILSELKEKVDSYMRIHGTFP